MTWQASNSKPSIMDEINGNITEWYEAVDNVLKKSEVIPGNYEYSVNTSYTSDGSFQEGGQTHVDILADRFKIISLDDSYITIEQEIPIKIPDQSNLTATTYYIGYKSALDAIDQFRIYSNSDLIQTQNHNHYESFVQYVAISDEAKRNSELYATYEKVQAMQSDVPGAYVDLSSIVDGNQTITIPIKVRIPVSQFLLLGNLKWFPGFWGKMTLEIYPSYKNIVICPIIANQSMTELLTATSAEVENHGSNIMGFNQINVPTYTALTWVAAVEATQTVEGVDAHYTIAAQTFTCDSSTTTNCHIRLAQYMVKMDVYNDLQANYIQVPMLFPIQQVVHKDFSGKIKSGANESFTCTHTAAINHCNSMFIVFPSSVHSKTVYENPEITYQVNIDGKYFPRESYKTCDDVRNMNLFLDATNFNTGSLFSIPDDVYHSVQPYYKLQTANAAGVLTENRVYNPSIDRSNFSIAIPFTNDDTFQGGIHTGGTVQVELSGSRQGDGNQVSTLTTISPAAIYIEDCICKFHAVKPSSEPQISITRATVEQLFAGR